MQHQGEVCLFKLGDDQESLAVLSTSDYESIIEKRCNSSMHVRKFVTLLHKSEYNISIEKSVLSGLGFTVDDCRFVNLVY